MDDWETLARRVVLDTGPYLKVELHRVRLPDGQVIEDWPWVITPDFVIVVAVTEDGRFLCFRQTKYSIDGVSLAPVGGYIDDGEPPLVAAKRELLEETGCQAERWTSLGSFPVDGNRGAGTAHLFLATGVVRVAEPNADDLEDQELHFLTRQEAIRAVEVGEFKVLPWIAAMALALKHTGS
ncbi:MAG: NUDIX hydrolase [Anaerolineae bacterium]